MLLLLSPGRETRYELAAWSLSLSTHLKHAKELLVHSSGVDMDQIMHHTLVCFRNHTPMVCIAASCSPTVGIRGEPGREL